MIYHTTPPAVPPSAPQGSAAIWFNVMGFGATGNGSTDDSVAIQNAFNTAISASGASNQGATVYFPPGRYMIGTTLTFTGGANNANVRLQGYWSSSLTDSSDDSLTSPASILIYTGRTSGSSASLMTKNPTYGFGCHDMGLTYNLDGYSGTLIDMAGSSETNSDGLEFTNCRFFNSASNTAAAYVDVGYVTHGVFSHCWFSGSVRAVVNSASSSGNTNGITFCDECHFDSSTKAPILNPDLSWSFISCLVEPMAGDVAGFIEVQSGFPSKGLTISGCYIGDDNSGTTGEWIKWYGSGLSMTGNFIMCNKNTTVLQILSGEEAIGISIQGNSFDGSGGYSTAVDMSLASSVSDFVFLGNNLAGITTPILTPPSAPLPVLSPTGSFFITAGDVANGTSAQFSGTVSAAGLCVGTGVGENLLPYNDANFNEGGASGDLYYPLNDYEPSGCTISVVTVGSRKVLALTPPSEGGNVGVFWPSPSAVSGGINGIPVVPNTNATVTIIASFQAIGHTTRVVQIVAQVYDVDLAMWVPIGSGAEIQDAITGEWALYCLTVTVPDGYSYVGFSITVSDTLDESELHYVSQVSAMVGTPWATYYDPMSDTVPPLTPPVLQISGSGIAQTGTSTTSVEINQNAGGTGGLVVGNGANSSLYGPITAGSLALATNPPGTSPYTPLYTDWLIFCAGGGSGYTVALPSGPSNGIALGAQFVIAKSDSSSDAAVTVTGTFVSGVTSVILSTKGATVTVALVQTGVSTYGWLII